MRTNRSSEHAAALVITLGFLVMITILVVAMMENTRIDRPAASSHFERMRAAQYAQAGVERVTATLGQFTSGSNRYWVSQPGQLIVSTTNNGLKASVPLHSGSISVTTGAGAVLNIATLRDPASNVITDGNNSMPVQWVQVLSDGTPDRVLEYDASADPVGYYWKANADFLPTAANPIAGRYAYWADDESCKINYNTAWGRRPANTSPAGSPTQIDLTALTGLDNVGLTGTMADALHAHITSDPNYQSLNKGFFNTPSDARQMDVDSPGIAAVLEKYKFYVTHYNHDPDTTFFNQPRIVLTTRPDRAGWTYKDGQWVGVNGLSGTSGTPYYIRILANEGTVSQPSYVPPAGNALDPGLFTALDSTKTNATVAMIEAYLRRADWPMVDGTSSFQSKYYLANPTRLPQLAINIIDYVRSKESAQTVVEPLRGTQAGSGEFSLSPQAADPTAYMGVVRVPMFTEMGASFVTVNGTKAIKMKAKLYLPPTYGISEVDLKKMTVQLEAVVPVGNYAGQYFSMTSSSVTVTNPSNPGSPLVLKAGNHVIISTTLSCNYGAPSPTSVRMRAALWIGSNTARLEVAPLNSNPLSPLALTKVLDPDSPDETMSSIEVDDPRVNKHNPDWTTGTNAIAFTSSISSKSTIGQTPASSPQQDTDAAGNISAASLYMPPPAGTTYTLPNNVVDDNTKGMVTSVGELGYIHTGVECSSTIPTPGTPWRTLRLQPNNQAASVVPDWALMDLFTVPAITSPSAAPIFAPHGNSYAGRVNLNASAEPFGDITRIQPLVAALMGAHPTQGGTALSLGDAQSLASNIYNRVTATNGKLYSYRNAYYSAGELAEIKDIADKGEESEQMIREIISLFTVRGDVFSVYTVGQALKQVHGNLVVTGEQRLQVLLERYVDVNGTVRFVPVYHRNLTP